MARIAISPARSSSFGTARTIANFDKVVPKSMQPIQPGSDEIIKSPPCGSNESRRSAARDDELAGIRSPYNGRAANENAAASFGGFVGFVKQRIESNLF